MKAIHTRSSLAKVLDPCRASTALLVLIALLLPLSAADLALAQGPDYTLEWWTVDGGGVVGRGAVSPYILDGTIGQPDAGVSGDGDYTLVGGFWVGGAMGYRLYLPLVLRDHWGE
jgi:hypothetical protein